MQIKIVSLDPELRTAKNGKTYKALTVVYKGDSGKIETKTLLPFGGNERSAKILSEADVGSVWEVVAEKNASGYWDWTSVSPSNGSSGATVSSAPAAARREEASNRFETAEERAKKQVYIVRQSSISAAVATLTAGVKSPPDPKLVIETAKLYEAYVFDTSLGEEVVASPPKGSVADLEDDIDF